ncbi:chorismate mutase [Streptomyces spirodelae]|uniref:Chorismate mutase n=1 Tax=Streptomyces spirodelae TaxID=2812904 RepID=A0ABS3WV49_9ACTN|nr:chorismate mutase [Streptomyces spirodelae]MBO8186727.1 chorismate mutase [Streptomyces spirodelae]
MSTTNISTGTEAAMRERIDALDARLIALVRDRMTLSESSGGRRVNLAREMEILGHYSTELGAPGRDLALTLLRLCRGH